MTRCSTGNFSIYFEIPFKIFFISNKIKENKSIRLNNENLILSLYYNFEKYICMLLIEGMTSL
jgi:hypothetical protein